MPQPPNERSHKALAVIEIIDKLLKTLEANERFTEEDLQDLVAHLAARCGQKFVWVNLVDSSPETQIIYQDEKSTITVADCYPCPISGKPCPTNGEMGAISHYYYPGDCPNFKACEDTATQTDPRPCGDTYANNIY